MGGFEPAVGLFISQMSCLFHNNYIEDIGRSLSPFVMDLPRLRKEYREIRRGPAIPIADMKRISVLEDFIEVLESTKPSGELISTLQAIL